MKMNSLLGKKVLALIRGGDYAHPGEEEAIGVVMSGIDRNEKRLVLDVGCGLGGTADFVSRSGFGAVTGIDIDEETIRYASGKYPGVSFVHADVCNLPGTLDNQFELIYLFNSFYAFPDHQKALGSIRKCAADGASLLIYDYAEKGNYRSKSSVIPNPVDMNAISGQLSLTGWELRSITSVTDYYISCYEYLMEMIRRKKLEITNLAGQDFYDFAIGVYSEILKLYQDSELEAVIVRAAASPKISRL